MHRKSSRLQNHKPNKLTFLVKLTRLFFDQVLSEVLSCISAMFILAQKNPEALSPILEKIFSTLSRPVTTQSKETRTLRQILKSNLDLVNYYCS